MIRTSIAAVPRLLDEILRDGMQSETDILLVGQLDDSALVAEVRRTASDVLILGLEEPARSVVAGELLRADPNLRIISVLHGGRDLSYFRLVPRVVSLGEASIESIVDVIRSVVRGDGVAPGGHT